MPSPRIIAPPWDNVAARTEKLALRLAKWKPPASNMPPGLGQALIRVFDSMARQVIERVNRVPDRSMFAFLNLVGVEPTPPRPAKVALSFALVEQGSAEPIVPAGTRVGAAPRKGDTREIIFETTAELASTRAQLGAVFARDTHGDRYSDRTLEATGVLSASFKLFEGSTPMEHSLYIGAGDILGLPAETEVKIELRFDSPKQRSQWSTLNSDTLPALASDGYEQANPPTPPLIAWEYWDGAAWKRIFPSFSSEGLAWSLNFTIPSGMKAKVIHNLETYWLRARLQAWPLESFPYDSIPPIHSIEACATANIAELKPDFALFGGSPIDLSMDFYPLGERPKFNDTFYVACDEVLSKPGAIVSVSPTKSDQQMWVLRAEDNPKIFWEVFTKNGWVEVYCGTKPASEASPEALWTASFNIPPDIRPLRISGKSAYWLRLRLVSGDFGKGIHVVNGVAQDLGYRPPLLKSLSFGYRYVLRNDAPILLRHNDLRYEEFPSDQVPFIRSGDPACLYLGFKSPFSNRNSSFYVQVAPPSILDAPKLMESSGPAPRIAWEYSAKDGWLPLSVEDETDTFIRSGIISFIGPVDFTRQSHFGQDLYWIRVSMVQGSFAIMPSIKRILTNTVWASHTATIRDEILGSSNGNAGQSFVLSQRPVLEGQCIDVREPDGTWVRWEQVTDFHASGPNDRHYCLDRRSAELSFGDGIYGMIPPCGVRNIRATIYRTGGGADGNRAAATINQLKTTVPYVDRVTNHESSSGGTDFEELSRLERRGPRKLRHGHRAVTVEDIEDLAFEASALVAQAKAITPAFDAIALADMPSANSEAGKVLLVIVPYSDIMPPMPTMALIKDVEDYIQRRCPATASLRVVVPAWTCVSAHVKLMPASFEGVEELRTHVEQAIARFLHPLSGGFGGMGWPFGQVPEESDIYRLLISIEDIEGVLEVLLSLEPSSIPVPAHTLIYPGKITVSLSSAS